MNVTNYNPRVMHFLTFILMLLLCANGCMSTRPALTASEMQPKREEIEVLCQEIDLLIRRMEQLQREPPVLVRQPYSLQQQAKDLDDAITILRDTRNRLGEKVRCAERMTGGDIDF